MLISLVVPYFKREDDLEKTFVHTYTAAENSPPTEICLFDYSRYSEYWRPAHAYNMAIRQSKGEYFVLMGADAVLSPNYIGAVRDMITSWGHVWMRCKEYKGIICCQRQLFLDAGGYDERFDLYGPEDQELEERLIRRGYMPGILGNYVQIIRTPDEKKIANYRVKWTKKQMATEMHKILNENRANNLMVANAGKEWGV